MFIDNFDRKDYKPAPDEIARNEESSVEFHDIFARYQFEIGMNANIKAKVTHKDDSEHTVKVLRPQSISRRTYSLNMP